MALPELTANGSVDLAVNGGLEDDKIGPAKALPVEVMALRVNAALPKNPSGFGAHTHVEAAAHSLALPDAGHGNRLQPVISLSHFV